MCVNAEDRNVVKMNAYFKNDKGRQRHTKDRAFAVQIVLEMAIL